MPAWATVFGVNRNYQQGEALASELQTKDQKFHFYAADLSTETACQQVVSQCCQICDRVVVLTLVDGLYEEAKA